MVGLGSPDYLRSQPGVRLYDRPSIYPSVHCCVVAVPRDIQSAGACPNCGAEGVQCRYNHFEKDDLRIDSWEHRCGNCGHRETRGFRSDDPDTGGRVVDRCPWCQRAPAE